MTSIYRRCLEQLNSQRLKVEWWWPRVEELGEMKGCCIGYRVSVLQDEKVLEMDGGDGCTMRSVCIYITGIHRTVHLRILESTFHYRKERLKFFRHSQNSISSFFFSLLPCLQLFSEWPNFENIVNFLTATILPFKN